jgi:hypothetical protein
MEGLADLSEGLRRLICRGLVGMEWQSIKAMVESSTRMVVSSSFTAHFETKKSRAFHLEIRLYFYWNQVYQADLVGQTTFGK